MKLSTNTTNYSTNITKAADFGIEDSDLSHIMGILRSQIYSDKLLAVIREYSTNAVDANIEAGNDNPIDVQLPTLEKPELSFRDFGHGLSDEEVCNLYVKYGASTKRSSNDYTGCLGIGCKAGFAYGDSFKVVSYTKQHITTWLARIDESKRGTISMLHKEPNINRPTGTDVIVTIRKDDIHNCITKAKQFFKYWINKPTCNEALLDLNIVQSTDEWAIQKETDSTGYSYGRNYGGANLVMGNIRYPIDPNQLNIQNDAADLTRSNSIIFYAPTGSVDIAANREALEYTDRTRNAIVAMTNNMLLDLIRKVTKHVASQPSRIKATIAADEYAAVLPGSVYRNITKQCTWNGLPLLPRVTFGSGVRVHERARAWRSSDKTWRNKSEDASSCALTKNVRFCVYSDDKIAASNATRRVRTLQHQSNNANDNSYYVIPRSTLDQLKPQLTADDYVDLDTIDPLKPSRTASTITNSNTNKPVRVNVCELTPNNLKSARLSKEAAPTAMSDGRYVYVPLDRFDWQGHEDWLDHLDNIRQALAFLTGTKLGNPKNPVPTIHGVKKHHVKKLDDKWITLDAYLAELFTKWKLNNQHDADVYAQVTSKLHHGLYNKELSETLSQSTNIDIARYGYVLSTYHKNLYYNYGNYKLRSGNEIINLFKVMIRLQITDQSSYLNDMHDYMNRHYPLLSYISIPHFSSNKDQIDTHIHKYIDSVTI